MWRKHTLAALRIINSTKFPFPLSDSLCFNLFYRNTSALHSSSSRFTERFGGSPFLSARTSFFPNPTILFGAKWIDILNFDHTRCFFCSESGSTEKLRRCWNCDAEGANTTPFLFCHTCRSVQPVDGSIDYFQIFGMERDYNVEVGELEREYKNWQRKLHPDLVHSKTQTEREYAAEQSARVIDAYRTLADPLTRAIYMMKLEGLIVDEEERITDLELLAEIMELREAVEEAEDAEALIQIQAQLQEKLQYWSNSFEDALRSKKYEDAHSSIRRMTYYKRANEEIIKKL
ncbi:iron-sulfur cluster co-chaperone protein HscB homolog [Primulina huaijiensis]|uniref:iron-sulfur cluster co-chaperone protein HscB homolog n=1 Tax=Primulina huaijiensis TaxID=1492673 RepID=UPI003CC75A17